jgi:hypothetical protein
LGGVKNNGLFAIHIDIKISSYRVIPIESAPANLSFALSTYFSSVPPYPRQTESAYDDKTNMWEAHAPLYLPEAHS